MSNFCHFYLHFSVKFSSLLSILFIWNQFLIIYIENNVIQLFFFISSKIIHILYNVFLSIPNTQTLLSMIWLSLLAIRMVLFHKKKCFFSLSCCVYLYTYTAQYLLGKLNLPKHELLRCSQTEENHISFLNDIKISGGEVLILDFVHIKLSKMKMKSLTFQPPMLQHMIWKLFNDINRIQKMKTILCYILNL